MAHIRPPLALAAMALGLLAACGYRFPGQGELPGGVTRVSVTVLENRSADTGLEVQVTNDLIYEVTRTLADAYAGDGSQADGVLSGAIQETRTAAVSRLSGQVALRRRVTLYADFRLTDRQGKVVWKVRRLSADQEYEVVADDAVTRENRRRALGALSAKLAEKVVIRLSETF